ncbi:LacI family DNA-binding transcriptional regulator [Paenibacillus thalictri]|uniref:LacI family transcriptional regulator n=1 Tax=Paenibacillus thalictri TaxID=2527873 RepID=A0A4Q9DSN7_9BACL|nr:LacI family DNA-binding transcriptional regulator [Paenibacillus thalictri]TBL79904.1 LacI family transcriptional regulator [Paenibacillus thalictri]
MSKKVTMQQIAEYLGVSKFVVSKALSGQGGVSETTREKVMQAASQLGYFSQAKAFANKQNVSAGRKEPDKQAVLVLMPNIRFQTKESLYWGRILNGISLKLEELGHGMILVSEQSNERFLQSLNPKAIMGMIGVGEISSPILLEVHRAGMPFVLVDHEDLLIPSDTVFASNYDSMLRLTRHLIGLGHKRLMFVGDIRYSRSFYDRWLGFRSALEEYGLDFATKESMLLHLHGAEAKKEQMKADVARCMQGKEPPTAFVCANDVIAIDLLDSLGALGIRVPEDVSVSGFDNIENSYRSLPTLTTVHVPKEILGQRAVERLNERIGQMKEPAEKLLIAGEVIYRDSTGRPPDSKQDVPL